jgi:uncharacterized protein (DUF2267 family)
MDYERFIDVVATVAALDRDGAERASRATLQTLGERIDREEARQIAAQLPPELAPWIATMSPAEAFDADELVRRVARREDVDVGVAERHVAAVFDALARTVSREEWDDMVAELPGDFARLLPRGREVHVVDLDTVLGLVARRAGLDREGARLAVEAALETLAERIAGGEVDDLMQRLPIELHEPLRRGRDAAGGQAPKMRLEAFVHRAAEREGVGDGEAARHLRAVFGALRETLGDELLDVRAQLPEDYVRALELVG